MGAHKAPVEFYGKVVLTCDRVYNVKHHIYRGVEEQYLGGLIGNCDLMQ